MYQPNPPQLPPGWIALWDEASQRYYYVEQATGTTQWDIPTGAPAEANRGGEASSYGSGYPPQPQPQSQQQNYSPYPPQQTLPQPGESSAYNGTSNSPTYPNQQAYGEQKHQQQQQPGVPGEGGPEGERGLGKMLTSFPGGAITGSLIGYAAGKYLGGNKPAGHNQGHHQSSGGMGGALGGALGSVGNLFQHQQHPQQQQYGGYGNYGPPPAQGGYPGYNPPPPSNYGGGYVKPPKKFGFF